MKVDFDNIESKLKDFSYKLSDISGIYKRLDWKDNVYDSYEKFDNEINNLKDNLQQISSNINSVQSNLSRIKESFKIKDRINEIRER